MELFLPPSSYYLFLESAAESKFLFYQKLASLDPYTQDNSSNVFV